MLDINIEKAAKAIDANRHYRHDALARILGIDEGILADARRLGALAFTMVETCSGSVASSLGSWIHEWLADPNKAEAVDNSPVRFPIPRRQSSYVAPRQPILVRAVPQPYERP